jgi:hypothetical protein
MDQVKFIVRAHTSANRLERPAILLDIPLFKLIEGKGNRAGIDQLSCNPGPGACRYSCAVTKAVHHLFDEKEDLLSATAALLSNC